MSIPFVDLAAQYARLKDDIDSRIQRVMSHGQFIMGPEVAELEDALCSVAGCKHAITTSSGTDALLAILMAQGIEPGDAVFLPAFTVPASAEVIALAGAIPVFVDVQADTCNMDPASLGGKIAQARRDSQYRPRAIIAVDLYGLPADYPAISEIAHRENLTLIADAAQSFGSTLNSQKVGTLADATAISFFPAKPLGCYGDGGAVLTDDQELAHALRSIRAHGRGETKYDRQRYFSANGQSSKKRLKGAKCCLASMT
jgi:UDP-2-acetamido-2-deoxy-ribo-hexuluronate aminotransferase